MQLRLALKQVKTGRESVLPQDVVSISCLSAVQIGSLQGLSEDTHKTFVSERKRDSFYGLGVRRVGERQV